MIWFSAQSPVTSQKGGRNPKHNDIILIDFSLILNFAPRETTSMISSGIFTFVKFLKKCFGIVVSAVSNALLYKYLNFCFKLWFCLCRMILDFLSVYVKKLFVLVASMLSFKIIFLIEDNDLFKKFM